MNAALVNWHAAPPPVKLTVALPEPVAVGPVKDVTAAGFAIAIPYACGPAANGEPAICESAPVPALIV